MWKYFGLPQLPHEEHWPATAHEFYLGLHADKELVRLMHNERKALPGAMAFIRHCRDAQKKGFAPSELPTWQQGVKSEEDLVTSLMRKVILMGEGDLYEGVRRFERMDDPVIELRVSES